MPARPMWQVPGPTARRGTTMLRRVRRLGRRMRRPGSSQLHRCLVVADVDLDTGTAIPRPPLTPHAAPPEGVHALVWLHGVPMAELTLAGAPHRLLLDLPDLARESATVAIANHLAQHDVVPAPRPLHERSPCTAEDGWRRAAADGGPLTVAVCTRDRPDDLHRCLTALERMTILPAEVVVIDNASTTDLTRDVVERHPGIRYVREPRQGIGWARNRALLEAASPLVAFVDDDGIVDERWAEALLMAFHAHPDAGAVTGLVSPLELSTPAQVQFEAAGGFGRGYRQRRLQADSTEPRAAARAVYHIGAMGTGANMAFRRERIVAVGGFDPALGAGTPTAGGDDLEALCRLVTAGDRIVYEPAAVVRHRHRRTMSELKTQRRGDGTGSASLLLGAGRKLGSAHHRQWTRIAVQWFVKNTTLTLAGSLIHPGSRPMSLTVATARGWLAAVACGYYGKAVDQAGREAQAHPDEPVLVAT
ncbi:glycosyltransferase family 2 protein [Geodermatophilus sp. SYSU D00867]